MDDKQDRILVLGATGRVGRHVVGELVRRLAKEPSDGPTIIYAATRDPTSGMYHIRHDRKIITRTESQTQTQ